MRPMKPDPGIRVQAVRIPTENGGMSALLLSPLAALKNAHESLRRGSIEFLEAGGGRVRFARTVGGETVECLADSEKKSFGFLCRG